MSLMDMNSTEFAEAGSKFFRSILGVLLIIALFVMVGGIFFRVFFVDHIDNYEIGYKFDRRSGTIEVIDKKGYYVSPPILVQVDTIDLRPMQVCINANSRVLNCKLVKFNPTGLQLFLSWHGRSSYSQATLNPILMSYAYDGSGKAYPFLEVLRELKTEDSADFTIQP
jgi:hypothetical protein